MTVILLLVVVVAAVWIIAAPGGRFLPEFARLLTEPKIERGAFSFFSGRSYATGRFEGRDVAIRLQLKRSRYAPGYLIVALRLEGAESIGAAGVDARTHDADGRRALSMIASHDLVPSVDEGWLKALWQPQGFIIFPGRYSPDTWREVMENMAVLATSLEDGAGL